MRGSAASGENIRAFAAALGVSERTARNYRSRKSAEWLEWSAARGASPSDAASSPRTGMVDRARCAESEAWRLLSSLQAQVAANSSRAGELASAIEKARKNWQAARQDLLAVEQQAGTVVPIENIRKIQQTSVAQLGQIWRTWQNKVAGDLLPAARPAFFAACRKNSRDWDAALARLDSEIESLLTC